MTHAIYKAEFDTAVRTALDALDRFDEALSRRVIDRALAPIETRLRARVAYLFERQGVRVARRLAKYRGDFLRESVIDDFDDLFDDAIQSTSVEMQAAIETAAKSALIAGGKALARDLDWARVFSLTNPRAVKYIADNGARSIANIDDTTRADIKTIVLAGIENGTSYTEVARQIRTRYAQYGAPSPQKHIRNRAELIAVTEAGNAYQAGNFIQAKDIAAAGVTLEKKWLTVGDKRVSAGCRENEAQDWISLDSDHTSGHSHPMRFPGCRCAEQYRRKR